MANYQSVRTSDAGALGARIDAIAYLDAFVPDDGQSLWDVTGEFEHRHYIDTQKHTPGLVAPIIGEENDLLGRHPLLTLDAARANAPRLRFDDLPQPRFTGVALSLIHI